MPRKPSGDFDKNRYINDFIKQKYDRINFTIPAGMKEIIAARAAQRGKSMNAYIFDLVEQDLKEAGLPVTEPAKNQKEAPEDESCGTDQEK